VFDVFAYEPDLSRPAATDDYYTDHSLRLTWQAARKHKIVASATVNKNCSCLMFLLAPQNGVLAAPEATGEHHYNPNTFPSVSWTFPATNRLLFESSVSMQAFHNTTKREPGVAPNVIQVTELNNNYRWGSRAVSINTAGGNYTTLKREFYFQRATASYITGSHNLKAGLERSQFNLGRLPNRYTDADQINGARNYTVRAMVPTQITIWAVPYGEWETARDLAFFAQDQWTVRKLTLNLGVRVNNFNGSIPDQTLPAGYFVPERHTEAVKDSPNWTNLNPRVGGAYDVFGTGKTAIKASLGRYTPRNTGAVGNPLQNMAQSANRTWTDANRDFVPDCDLRAPAANGECGPLSDLTFGLVRPASVGRAPDSLGGFNKDSYNWQASLALQHELRSNMALNLGYFRTWYGNFLVTDNLAITPDDYDPFCITAPTDSRLPGDVSGKQICGLYDIKPAKFGQVNNLVTQSSHFGGRTEVYNGIDVSLNTRFAEGGVFQGGLSVGRTVEDSCVTVDQPQNGDTGYGITVGGTAPGYCRVTRPWAAATQLKFMVVYPLPWNLQTSAVYQNIPGMPINTTYLAVNAEIAPSLGRNLVGRNNVVIDLVPPNTIFEPRLQQVDLRVSRTFVAGKARLRANLDLYNALNASSVLNQTTRYGPQWMNVVQVMGGRMLKFGGEFQF
jgi:hypothetical protein